MSARTEQLLVVVSVLEGRHFPKIPRLSLVVQVSFDGEHLATDPVEHREQPQFHTELAWELDRRTLHQHRLQRTPIKLQCFTVDAVSRKRDAVGYVVLDLRSLREVRQEPRWFPLLSSRYTNQRPALLLGTTLETDAKAPQPSPDRFRAKEAPPRQGSPSGPDLLPDQLEAILVSDQGYHQVGPPDVCSDIFVLSVTVAFASSLEHLIPSTTKLSSEDSGFFFYYSLLGNDITSEPFYNLLRPDFQPERASVRIRSRKQVLQAFLSQQPSLQVHLCCGTQSLGSTDVSFSALAAVSMDVEKKVLTVEGAFALTPPKRVQLLSLPADLQPTVGVAITLRREELLLQQPDVSEAPPLAAPQRPQRSSAARRPPDLPPSSHTESEDSLEGIQLHRDQAAASEDGVVHSRPPAASEEGVVHSRPPAASEDGVVRSRPPAASEDGVVRSRPPAASEDGVVRSRPPAASEDGVVHSRPPAASEDGVVHSRPPAASEDGVVRSRPPPASGDGVVHSRPPAASEDGVVHSRPPRSQEVKAPGQLDGGPEGSISVSIPSSAHHYGFSLDLRSLRKLSFPHPIAATLRYSYQFFGSSAPIMTNPPVELQKNMEVSLPQSYCAFDFAALPHQLQDTFLRFPLEVQLWHRSSTSRDQLIGRASIQLSHLLNSDRTRFMGSTGEQSWRRSHQDWIAVVQTQSPTEKVAELNYLATLEDHGFIRARQILVSDSSQNEVSAETPPAAPHPAEARLAAPHPAEARLAAPHPAEARLAAPHPAEARLAAPHPAEARLAAPHPAETRPAAPHPAETRPAAPHPAEARLAAPHPAETRPAAPHPAEARPAAPHPAEARLAAPHPAEARLAAPHPAEARPAAPHPAETRPAAPRETLEYRMALELELWKEQQEDLFDDQLKKKELRHMQALAEEWKKRDGEREALVKKKELEYNLLEEQLLKTLSDLEKREKQLAEAELQQTQQLQRELRAEHQLTQKELQDNSRRLQRESDHRVELEREKVHLMEDERARLLQQISDGESRYKQLEKEFQMFREQNSSRPELRLQSEINLLMLEKVEMERKLESTTKSKLHYKQQWGRTLKELARFKQREQENAMTRLKKQQAELEAIRLRYLATEEKEAVRQDRRELDDIRNEINRLKKQEEKVDHAPSKPDPAPSKPDPAPSKQDPAPSLGVNESAEEHLCRLLEERDTLLRTGVYTHEDRIIAELNRQIQDAMGDRSRTP